MGDIVRLGDGTSLRVARRPASISAERLAVEPERGLEAARTC
jgi:hypothetical protein